MNIPDMTRRFATYFRRGYGVWLVLIIGFGNFVGIWYRLLGLDAYFPTLLEFAIFAAPVVIVLATVVGYLDIKRGLYQREAEILTLHNPVVAAMAEDVKEINRRLERVLEQLEVEA